MVDRAAPVALPNGEFVVVEPDRKFGRVVDVERYLVALWASLALSGRPPSVRLRRGTTKAHWEAATDVIAMPDAPWALREVVVLHEVAHALVWRRDQITGHGPVFCREYAHLVGRVNPSIGLILTDAFHSSELLGPSPRGR